MGLLTPPTALRRGAAHVGQYLLDRPAAATVKAPLPQNLVLDWTDYCNAKCFFCWRDNYERQIGGKGDFIPFSRLKKLEKVLSAIKIFSISSAIGEPLLHPELEQILRWLYAINPTILLRLVTNGTPLTASKAPWFAGHLDWLSVSLNAANGEAHMRDMFPHLAVRGIDAQRRWELHLRHLAEFITALPPPDRARIRLQMVAHRDNIKDIADFVRVVHSVGGSHAVITNISPHPRTIDYSLYWIKDLYNDCIDEACEVGAQLGVKVDAMRFFTTVRPNLNLNRICREPIESAYISRSSLGAPCCHWIEPGIPASVYDDETGFERYWNHDILRRLRESRDSRSCQACAMSRVFDETSFHFSPSLKRDLMKSGQLSDVSGEEDYPDAGLVRTCVENRLDLPSIRRTLLALDLPTEMTKQIELAGVGALATIDRACWEAFKQSDAPAQASVITLAGPFLGIGWGIPIHAPQNKLSARCLGGAVAASIFVRAEPATTELRFTINQVHPLELQRQLQLTVNGRPIATRISRSRAGRSVLSGRVPDDLMQLHGGRLWVRIECPTAGQQAPACHVSFMRLEISEPGKAALIGPERAITAKDRWIARQKLRLAQLERELQATCGWREWRITASLRKSDHWRKMRSWLLAA